MLSSMSSKSIRTVAHRILPGSDISGLRKSRVRSAGDHSISSSSASAKRVKRPPPMLPQG